MTDRGDILDTSRFSVGRQKIQMTDAERHGKLVYGNDGRVPQAILQAAQILLAETGAQGQFLLSQALLPTQARKVATDQICMKMVVIDRWNQLCCVLFRTKREGLAL